MTERLCLSTDSETIVAIDALAMADGRSRSAMAGRLIAAAIKQFINPAAEISLGSGGGAGGFITQAAPGGAATLTGTAAPPTYFNEVEMIQNEHTARQMAAREAERQAKADALARAKADTLAAQRSAYELDVFKRRTPEGEGE